MKKLKKILYFVKGAFPTKEQFEEAEKLNAIIRNADAVIETSPIEKCDEVYGNVPDKYKHLISEVNQTDEIEVEQPKKTKKEPNFKTAWKPN